MEIFYDLKPCWRRPVYHCWFGC